VAVGDSDEAASVDEDHSDLRLQSFPIALSFFVTELH